MFISKRKVISVLADSVAVCQRNIRSARRDKSKYGSEWFNYYENKQSCIMNEILDIARRLEIMTKVIDKSNYLDDKWRKERGAENE